MEDFSGESFDKETKIIEFNNEIYLEHQRLNVIEGRKYKLAQPQTYIYRTEYSPVGCEIAKQHGHREV